ncbi:MAG TPA: MFS transporter [Nocardioides sp.]|uniref:MFS transporter n=1 Tax=Nocardioides sp. TaxID=35761 RepID=UPI002F41037D
MKQAFRQPGFSRLYAGLTTSMFGDSVMLLVLSMWVKSVTGSNGMAGLTFFFMVIPALFAPLLGIWIDRLKRRPLLVWGHVASGVGVLPLVLVRGEGQVWIIWAVAMMYGASFVILPAALNGLLKELMPEDMLVDANSSLQTTKESFRLFGPLIGALLFTWLGGWAVAVLDAASFFLAAIVIATIAVQEQAPEREDSHFWQQMTAGLRHLAADRVLEHTLVGFGICILVFGFAESAVYALLDGFDKPVTWVSAIVTAQGIGAIGGGLSSSAVVRRIGEVAGCVVGLFVAAVSILAMAAAQQFWVVLAMAVVMGAAMPLMMVAFMTLIQRRTPQAIMGRVSAAVEVVMAAPQAISLAVGSLLVVVLSYRTIFVIMGAVTLVASAYIVTMLRDQIADDVRRPVADGPEPVVTGSPAMDPAVLAGAPAQAVETTVTES